MPGENIQDWSTTATLNGNADSSINWSEGQPRDSVNNSARSMMAAHAKQRNLLNGSIVAGGATNALTFTSGVGYTTIPTGLMVKLKIAPALTNTGTTTLDMDGIGAVTIKTQLLADLTGGELLEGTYREFLYNGTNWVLLRGGSIVLSQVFTASGTYTPTPGMTHCIIECCGGGGGGGGAAAANVPLDFYMGGGGGGSGGYSRKYATATDIGVSQVVTIGAAGTGGSHTVASGAGGSTTVGSLCGAFGGAGGGASSYGVVVNPVGGAGGASGTGTIAAGGSAGGQGMALYLPGNSGTSSAMGGAGGGSHFGGGGQSGLAYQSGANGGSALAYGSGGGGGASAYAGFGAVGGNGSAGVVVITEFVSS